MTAAPSRSTPIVGPLLVVGTAYLFFFAGAYFGIFDVRVRITSLVIVGIVLGLYAVAAARSERWFPVSRLWPALAIGVGVLAIGTVFSENRRISLDFLAYGVLLAGLYLLLRGILADADLRPRLGAAIVILAFGVNVAYLAVVVGDWLTWWQVLGRLAVPPLRPFYEGLTYGNPGLVAAMAVMASVSATAQLGWDSRRSKAVVAVLWVLTTTVVFVSGTRGAWVALAVTAVAAGLLFAAQGDAPSRVRGVLATNRGRAIATVIGIVVVVGIVLFGPAVADRVLFGGEGGRFSYWTAALRMFGDAPLTGVGPGMWAPERILHTAVGELDFYIPHAHNVYLQTAAESGVVGLAAGVVVLVLVARLIWAAIQRGDAVARRWAFAAILAAVYFGVHQLFDMFVNMPAALFVFAFPIAWLDANGPPAGAGAFVGWQPGPRGRGLMLAGGALAVAVAVGWGLAGERSALALDAAKAALDAGDSAAATAQAGDAVAIDPSIAPNQLLLALAAVRENDAAVVAPALQSVVDSDGLPPAWIDLAWLDASAGDAAGARAALDAGLRLGQQQAAITLAAGRIYEMLGDLDASSTWYTTALTQLPRLAADPFWQASERSERWRALLDAAATGLSPADQVDLFLSAGDAGRAGSAAATAPDPELAATLQQIVAAWGGDTPARAALDAAAYASPRDTWLLGWCARIADRFGDTAAGIDFRYLADIQASQAGTNGLEVKIVSEVQPPANVAGTAWPPYGIYTYRRPTPGALLLSGMPQIVWGG